MIGNISIELITMVGVSLCQFSRNTLKEALNKKIPQPRITIHSYTMQNNTVPCSIIQSHTIQSHTIQSHAIQYKAIQYNTKPYNTNPFNTGPFNTKPLSTIRCRTVQQAATCNHMWAIYTWTGIYYDKLTVGLKVQWLKCKRNCVTSFQCSLRIARSKVRAKAL